MRRTTPIADRFAAKVRKTESGCWEWTAARTAQGYGRIGGGRREAGWQLAHRVSYELHVGPIPAGLQLDHLCRNRGCVNPEHLEPVTPAENVRRGIRPQQLRDHWASITHCKHGHPFDEANTYIKSNGNRGCRACLVASSRASYLRRKAATA